MNQMNQRAGNFDLMRLVAASLVFWSHQYSITGFKEPVVPWVGSLGGFAVYVFFAISGYLNSQSVVRSRSSAQFLISRAFRIYPALIVCVVLCVVMGAFVSNVLRKWVKGFGSDPVQAFPGHGQMKPEQQAIERLRREVAKLKAERDILKKAAAYFAKEAT